MTNRKNRKGEKGWNPEVNRRWFLRRAAVTGGGVLFAESILSSSLKAQIPRVSSTASTQLAPESLPRIRSAYQKIKSTGNFRTIGAGWAAPLRDLTPVERVAAVSILEISQRNLSCKDIGGKIGLMLKAATEARADTLTEIRTQVIQQATGGICGGGCTGAGYICGFVCSKVTDVMLAVDQMGSVLQSGDFANAAKDIVQTSAAMNGAAAAYREIFG